MPLLPCFVAYPKTWGGREASVCEAAIVVLGTLSPIRQVLLPYQDVKKAILNPDRVTFVGLPAVKLCNSGLVWDCEPLIGSSVHLHDCIRTIPLSVGGFHLLFFVEDRLLVSSLKPYVPAVIGDPHSYR